MNFRYADIARMLDHALLAPSLDDAALEAGCVLARRCEVASAMVLPHFAKRAAELLEGSSVVASSTVGFPHGAQHTELKAREAELLLAAGCRELDMVVNVSKVKSHDFDYVRADIRAVLETTHASGALLKVIFENCYLSNDEKIALSELCSELGADFIKTSTGFGTGGSTRDDLVLMRKHAAPGVQVKAAGGLRDLDSVLEARELGVTRVGSSSTLAILKECRWRLISAGQYDGPELPESPGSVARSGY